MPNLRIVTSKLIDAATLSASPAALATLPVTNLQNTKRTAVWRSTSTASQSIRANFADTTSINSVVLYGHNLQTGSTWRIRLYSGANQTGTLLYDSGVVDVFVVKSLGALNWGIDPLAPHIFNDWENKGQFVVLWILSAIDSCLSIDMTLADAANTNGYLQAIRWYAGLALEPMRNPQWGDVSVTWADTSTQARTDGGSLRTDAAVYFRTMAVKLSRIDGGERARFLELARWAGKRRDFYFCLTPEIGDEEERDYSIAAKFAGDIGQTPTSWGMYSMSDLQLEEI